VAPSGLVPSAGGRPEPAAALTTDRTDIPEDTMPSSRREPAEPAAVERFRPGGVLHAVASGLLELALALVLLGLSQLAGEANGDVAASLVAAAVLWAVLGVYSLATGALRARVWEAELDDEAVVLHGAAGMRRWRYAELSAVEIGGGRTRLVTRDGRTRRVRGVRGGEQGRRFRARVLARATTAARGPAGADRLPGAGPDGGGGHGPGEPAPGT